MHAVSSTGIQNERNTVRRVQPCFSLCIAVLSGYYVNRVFDPACPTESDNRLPQHSARRCNPKTHGSNTAPDRDTRRWLATAQAVPSGQFVLRLVRRQCTATTQAATSPDAQASRRALNLHSGRIAFLTTAERQGPGWEGIALHACRRALSPSLKCKLRVV